MPDQNPYGESPEGFAEALRRMRMRLLDLTKRNRLINFKYSRGRNLQFVDSAVEGVFARLMDGAGGTRVLIGPVPDPDRNDWLLQDGRRVRPEARIHAAGLGIGTSTELLPGEVPRQIRLQSLHYADELDSYCRRIDRAAKLAIEETGANALYLVHAFLEYPEERNSENMLLAPLVSVPVRLEKTSEGRQTGFGVVYTGEELEGNLSLKFKLEQDFGIQLPDLEDFFGTAGNGEAGAAQSEDSAPALTRYFDALRAVFKREPGFQVRRRLSLVFLSFGSMLLFRDLDPENWPKVGEESSFLKHPLVRQVLSGRPGTDEDAGHSVLDLQYAEDYEIDAHPKVNLPLIFDADSSQHSALIDALDRKSIVVEGPPGTGKSQTITNLLALAIHRHWKVLFVAEKLAALQVVKNRLDQANLGQFVLELHSNRTNRKQVLEDIQARIDFKPKAPKDIALRVQRLEEKRLALKAYADLINSVIGNRLGLNIHTVLWRAERYRQNVGESTDALREVKLDFASSATGTYFQQLWDCLTHLGAHYQAIGYFDTRHPFWGFFPDGLNPGDDFRVRKILLDYSMKFDELAEVVASAKNLLGNQRELSSAKIQDWLNALASIAPDADSDVAFELLPLIFSQKDSEGAIAEGVCQEFREGFGQLRAMEQLVSGKLTGTNIPGDNEGQIAAEGLQVIAILGAIDKVGQAVKADIGTLEGAIARAKSSAAEMRRFAPSIGLEFDGSELSGRQVRAVVHAATSAPMELLHLRHRLLGEPQAFLVLTAARRELTALKTERALLKETFRLDAVTSESELEVSIETLRGGEVWYRIFQKPWRNAVAYHQKIERSLSKKRGDERLKDLEIIAEHVTKTKAWRAREDVKRYSGEYYKQDDTPVDALASVTTWIALTRKSLDECAVAPNVFDPLSMSVEDIGRRRNVAAPLKSGLEGTYRLLEALKQAFPAMSATLRGEIESEEWPKKIQHIQDTLNVLKRATALAESYCVNGMPVYSALGVVQALRKASALAQVLNQHRSAATVFAARFRGIHTKLEPIEAAIAYGRQIKRAPISEPLKEALLAGQGAQDLESLQATIRRVKQGWDHIDEFQQALSKFGPFDFGSWSTSQDASLNGQTTQCLSLRTRNALDQEAKLLPWAQYVYERQKAIKYGLEPLVKLMEFGQLPSDRINNAFGYCFYAAIADDIFNQRPELRNFSGTSHSKVRDEYVALDKELVRTRGLEIAAECVGSARPPAGTRGARVMDKTEMELLNYLLPQARPRVSIRKMLTRAGKAIQALKPCMMTGPQALAQFVAPEGLKFDIVVMDEASQLKPEVALGAVARGGQLIVVGDPKQLPPTSFFDRQNAQADESDDGAQTVADEAESILDVCLGHFRPIRSLRWHYRSQHESLIAFSNQTFYQNRLQVFPSPYPKGAALGVRSVYVPNGVYGNRRNEIEARRVVDSVIEHITVRPEESLGVVTVNLQQRELIEELLFDRLRNVPQAAKYMEVWEEKGMPLFVKNLENVQGDERDYIFISTTYGKAPGTTVVAQRFGPINGPGGSRRLNVLFTRARKSITVFTSMRPQDIPIDAQTRPGTRVLHDYLYFAQTGQLPPVEDPEAEADSDFEVAVANVLIERGFQVTPQLGVAGFRIDIAVKHPQCLSGYLAAIECDGATYHSAQSVRDRDRIRQEILESLGWKGRIWRIWSTDWFRNADAEAKKMFEFLKRLAAEPLNEAFTAAMAAGDHAHDHTAHDAVVEEPQELVGPVEVGLPPEEDELEVQVGDLVAFRYVDEPVDAQSVEVRITSRRTDAEHGLIAENTPLAQTLLGGVVGETVSFRVPSRPAREILIKEIRRDTGE